MSFTVEKLEGEPIVIATIEDSFRMGSDLESYITALRNALDVPESYYFITNVEYSKLTFGELVGALGTITRGTQGITDVLKKHKLLIVAHSSLVSLGAGAFNQMQYGGISTKTFTEMDEALAHARSQPAVR